MRTQSTTEPQGQIIDDPVIRRVRASLPATCCGRQPPEFDVVSTFQLLHVLCGVCGRYHALFTASELRLNFGKAGRPVDIAGVKHSVAEWCVINGIPEARAYYRIYSGWTPERAVTQPVDYSCRPKAAR